MNAREAVLVIEGEERELKQRDFVHCPPWAYGRPLPGRYRAGDLPA